MGPLLPFLGLCLLISLARLGSQHLIDRTGQSAILQMRMSLGEMLDAVRVMGETLADHGFQPDISAAVTATQSAYDASRAAAAR